MNRTEKECQPCADYDGQRDGYGLTNRHECFSPSADGVRRCVGLVSFCLNCHADHHEDGYQSCTGTWHDGKGKCTHQACVARRALPAVQQ